VPLPSSSQGPEPTGDLLGRLRGRGQDGGLIRLDLAPHRLLDGLLHHISRLDSHPDNLSLFRNDRHGEVVNVSIEVRRSAKLIPEGGDEVVEGLDTVEPRKRVGEWASSGYAIPAKRWARHPPVEGKGPRRIVHGECESGHYDWKIVFPHHPP
jgi:hypothetical protein